MPPANPDGLRLLIRQKLDDGRLPTNHIPRTWGGAGNGKKCDACEQIVRKTQMMIEGASSDDQEPDLTFHVPCFYFWETERKRPAAQEP